MLQLSFLVHLFATLVAAAPRQFGPGDVHSLEPGYFHRDTNGRLRTSIVPSIDKTNHQPVLNSHFSKLAKSTTYPQTNFTFGDQKVVWGCNIDPAATLGNLSSISGISGSCNENQPYALRIIYAVPKNGAITSGQCPSFS